MGAFRYFDSRNGEVMRSAKVAASGGDAGRLKLVDDSGKADGGICHKELSPAWLNRPGRRILLCDMDTFFVSVERLFDRSLIGKPVIVGGPKGGRGIVAACSYEAREFGVRSGMSLWQAGKLCPHGEYVHGRGHDYSEFSERVRGILEENLPSVKAASIDEFYCDVTGMERVWPSLYELGHFLKREVYVKTGLPMTIGGGRNRIVAKIASGIGKPNGLFIVPEGREKTFLGPLPVRKLPGVGPKTAEYFKKLGIETIGDIAEKSPGELRARLGKWGKYIWEKANGREAAIYIQRDIPRSIGHESTFRADISDAAKIAGIMRRLLEKAMFRLRREGLKCRMITVKLRYHDFDTHTAQTGIPATDVDRVAWPFALMLLGRLGTRRAAVRLVGVRLSELIPAEGQLEMFEPDISFCRDSVNVISGGGENIRAAIAEKYTAGELESAGRRFGIDSAALDVAKEGAMHATVDAIRNRFGYDAIKNPTKLLHLYKDEDPQKVGALKR